MCLRSGISSLYDQMEQNSYNQQSGFLTKPNCLPQTLRSVFTPWHPGKSVSR